MEQLAPTGIILSARFRNEQVRGRGNKTWQN